MVETTKHICVQNILRRLNFERITIFLVSFIDDHGLGRQAREQGFSSGKSAAHIHPSSLGQA